MRGVVTCAAALSQDELTRLENKFTAMLGKMVTLQMHINPRVIGGIQVELEGRMWDSTIRGRLQQAYRAMLAESQGDELP